MDKESLPPDLRDLADNEAKKEDYRTLWTLLHRPASRRPASSFDVDDAWRDLSDSLSLDTSSPRNDRAPRPSGRPSRSRGTQRLGGRVGLWTSVAASVLMLAVMGGLLGWWMRPVTVSTAAGQQMTVTLPDGSTVALNGASRLRYDRGFARFPFIDAPTRSVELRGEGYFRVEHGERPFHVATKNAVVRVLGTAFTVRAMASDETPSTDVILESGRVRVASRRGTTGPADEGVARSGESESVVLDAPGMRSRVLGTLKPEAVGMIDLKYMAAWRTGGFAAQDAPLHTILRDLEHQFGASLRLADDVNRSGTLTLHYGRRVDLDDVLRDICVIQGLSYRKTQDGYLLEPA